MRVASFDIGTNTVLCLIAEIQEGHIQHIYYEGIKTVRLGEGVDQNKRFSEAALQRLDEALSHFQQFLNQHLVERYIVAATSASRDVTNRAEYESILARYGLKATVLTGDQEAHYTFTGAVGAGSQELTAVVDVGGGSTEITLGRGGRIIEKKSFDVGSVRLFERYKLTTPESQQTLDRIRQDVRDTFSEVSIWPIHDLSSVVAVAGTPTNLASIVLQKPFDAALVDGFELTQNKIDALTHDLSRLNIKERCQISGLDAGRADVIVVGSIILSEALNALKCSELKVSVRGLRYGVLVDDALWSVYERR